MVPTRRSSRSADAASPSRIPASSLQSLLPTEPVSLGDQAYWRIRADILTLGLPPGAKLSEGRLTKLYHLGRSPVRAGLNRLIQDGLVVNAGRGGTLVTPLTLENVAEIFAMRRLLEPEAARLAAGSFSAAQLARLRRGAEASYDRGSHASLIEFLLSNREFNLLLGEACGNALLARAISELEDLSLRILYVAIRERDIGDSYRAHQTKMYEALASGDSKRASELALTSLNTAADAATAALIRLPSLRSVNISL